MADSIAEFRRWAYYQHPELGREVDAVILEAQGLGQYAMGDATDVMLTGASAPADPGSISTTLQALNNNLQNFANAGLLSLKNYYDAKTMIATMQAANKAGVPVDQYTALANTRNLVTAATGGPDSLTANILGVPLWVWLAGGAATMLFMSRR